MILEPNLPQKDSTHASREKINNLKVLVIEDNIIHMALLKEQLTDKMGI
jgi:hypothetical protein